MRLLMLFTLLCVTLTGAAALHVGETDTVGGTTYDWQGHGPMHRMFCSAGGVGRHALWMYSADTLGTTFPDRNMRYNFYDDRVSGWSWIEPDFMGSGINVYQQRSGFGNIGANPFNGAAVVVAHQGQPLQPVLAQDISAGGGVFEFCPGPDSFLWPVLAVGGNGWYHAALIDDESRDQVWYSRCTTWCQWEPPRRLSGGTAPDPGFPAHNIAASAVSRNVCAAWLNASGEPQESIYYRISSDGGTTWGEAQVLPMPPAYGPDTLPSFTLTSPFPWYDQHDRLHFVVDVAPVVRDTMRIMPAEIWHWCEVNTPQWSRVHRAGCAPEHLQGAVGYNATYACRPTIGEDLLGNLLVTWEQFDSANVEWRTGLLRAGIWVAASPDSGMTWYLQRLLTERDSVSHRFPCIIDRADQFEFRVLYIDDIVAGFYVQGQGPATYNPIIAHRWNPLGTSESPADPQQKERPDVVLSRGVLYLPLFAADASYTLFDLAGRELMRLVPGRNELAGLSPGTYFVRACSGDGMAWTRLILVR